MSTNDTGPANRRIVIGVDGSAPAAHALAYAIDLARGISAEVIAVFAIAPAAIMEYGYGAPVVPPQLDPEWRAEMEKEFVEDWCRPLRESGLKYRTAVRDGRPSTVIADVADSEDAYLVVVGRRGRGGVAELLLGSVSHELSHHCTKPVLLVSGAGHSPEAPAV